MGARIMTQPTHQPVANYDARLGALENDGAGIESGISLIMQKIDARSGIKGQPIGGPCISSELR
jgi:hypothetical protein